MPVRKLKTHVLSAVVGIVVGSVATFVLLRARDGAYRATGRRELKALTVGARTLMFPNGARLAESDGAVQVVSWAPLDSSRTRCGSRAEARLQAKSMGLPDSFSTCGAHNYFAGGSSDGECPATTVCVARRGQLEMKCESDDDACRAVVEAFALGPHEEVHR
jgi:hypothetical protein